MQNCAYYSTSTSLNITTTPAQCLTISRAYFLAFIAGQCTNNQIQEDVAAVNCFDLANGKGYGKWVNYYASTGGIVLSASIPNINFMGGPDYYWANAPPSGQGEVAPVPGHANTTVSSRVDSCAKL